jgi:uncharacterized protein (DUF697 family)
MADVKTEPPAAAKKTGRRTRPSRATQNATPQSAPLQAEAAKAPSGKFNSLSEASAAYAKGELSLEELTQMRQAAKSPQRQAAPARAMAMSASQIQATAQAPQRQMAEGLGRLQKAKQMGVLSKGETDRAADTLIAESPNATAPPTKVEIKTPRQPMAESIVKTSATYAGAAGLLSLGFVDILVVPVIQLKMLQNLCGLYTVTFTEEWGKNVIAALVGTVTARSLATRAVPVLGFIAAPVSNAATTWALGKVFIQHFESGGTLLSFAPDKLKGYFAEYYQSSAPLVAATA